MKRFDETGLWKVLKTYDNGFVYSEVDLRGVIDDFVDYLHAYCRQEKNIAEKTRSLTFARSELTEYLDYERFESKKHTLIRALIRRAIGFIEDELNIINLDLEHPDRFIEFPSDNPPLARWGGKLSDLIEYTIGPQIAGMLRKPSGQPMNYAESIVFLEKVFGIRISQPHDRRAKVLDRQKNTAFQDNMRHVFLEEARKRNED